MEAINVRVSIELMNLILSAKTAFHRFVKERRIQGAQR